MESVYFGKENTEALFSDDKYEKQQDNNIKEYYFPDERRAGFKALRLISALLLTGYVDFFVIGIGFMNYFISHSYDIQLYKYIDIDYTIVFFILFAYGFVCILITPLFYNAGREKTYVRYGNTFYILKYSVRVRINKYFFLSSTATTENRIHKRYARYIRDIDKSISKGRMIKKILTDCKISDNADAPEGTIEGFNEKKFRDEEFRIPARYSKYDPEKKYYTPSVIPLCLFLIIKATIYITVFMLFVNNGKVNYGYYKAGLDSYMQKKSDILAPYGYEYVSDNMYRQECVLEYENTSEAVSRIRFYTGLDKGIIRDYTVSLDLSLNYEDNLNEVYDLVQTAGRIDIRGEVDLEDFVEQFRNGTLDEPLWAGTIKDKGFSYEIRKSYPADYNLYIFIIER